MANILGIDLGTTNSVLSYLDSLGKPKIHPGEEGNHLTPSVVAFEKKKVLVGTEAKKKMRIDSENVFSEFKRDMGTDKTYEYVNKKYTPKELSGIILKKMVENFEKSIGEADEIVITTPANFSNEAREDTLEAGEIAGFKIKNIINEPTAAALYFSHELGLSDGNYVIYDLGGGTFDVSIISIIDDEIEVLTSSGVNKLGGADFDLKLLEIISTKFKNLSGEDLIIGDTHELIPEIEESKKTLSSRDNCFISVLGSEKGRINFEISREEYVKSINVLIAQTEMLSEQALKDADLTVDDINDILLVGGATRTPAIQDSVEKIFDKKPKTLSNPDEVVALGAALYAGLQSKDILNIEQKKSIDSISMQDVCNHYFGTLHGVNNTVQNAVVIEKNTPLPATITTDKFVTIVKGQTTVRCTVTQSSAPETDPNFVKIVWEGKLGNLPPGRPAGQQIEISFNYDLNQVMHCSFKDISTGNLIEVDLNEKNGINREAKVKDLKDSIDEFLIE